MLACLAGPLTAAAPRPGPGGPAGRCAALEHEELAEARAARDQAAADCTAGQYGFGIALIESALRRVGIALPPP